MKITLENLHEATPQEVFNQVYNHAVTQRERSFNEDEQVCMYRHGSLKCAAGCLIHDDEYDHTMGSETWWYLVDQKKVPKEHSKLIGDLQSAHDDASGFEEWLASFKTVAAKYKLEIPTK